jgi:5'-phosphate synthase pdxT subunit
MIGVLGLQGGFAEHVEVLHSFLPASEVRVLRHAGDLQQLKGLVIPGGESTVMRLGLHRDSALHLGLMHAIHSLGIPTLATCAGLILLADRVRREKGAPIEQGCLSNGASLDVTVVRNWYGAQGESFHARMSHSGVEALFIRAPHIEAVGCNASVLDWVQPKEHSEQHVVVVQQAAILGMTGHPELLGQPHWHREVFGGGGASKNKRAFDKVSEKVDQLCIN